MIIGFAGKMGAGKNLSASFVKEAYPSKEFEEKSFAYKIKQVTSLILGCEIGYLEDREYKKRVLDGLSITPRKFMQLLGTDFGRKMVHPDIWVNALLNEYSPIGMYSVPLDFPVNVGSHDVFVYPNWLITDVRFPNEVKAIEDHGGKVIKLTRSCGRSKHESETALDGYNFDYVINNNGTKEELRKEVLKLVDTFNF